MTTVPVRPLIETTVNPPVSTEIFVKHPEATYWIGRVATGGIVQEPEYYDALGKFRANVYVDQLKFLGHEHVDTFGREYDKDDERAINFAVVENRNPQEGHLARIVGSGRLIMKRTPDDDLPIETYFPEIFADNPLPAGTVEVSRFIARHESNMTQHTIALALIRAMTHRSVANKVEAAYCIIEKPLLDLLSTIGLPIEVLGGPKDIDEYGGTLYPVHINPYEILRSVGRDITGKIALRRFFEEEIPNQGEGFYPRNLIGGVRE